MSLASSSAVTVRAIKESTFGVIPVAGNPSVLRVTGESLSFEMSKEASKEINSRRTIASMTTTSAKASGGLDHEVYYAGVEPLLESTMQSAFSEFGTDGVGAAVSVDVTTTTITAAIAPTGANAFTTLQKGQWFRLVSAGVNNGSILRVSTITAPTSTVITLDVSTVGVAATGESVQIQSARLTHGTTKTSWTIERENSDIGVFMAYTGMTPSKFTMAVSSGSLSSLKFEFMGKAAVEANATQLPGSPVDAPTYNIHSGVGGATNAIWMDGVPVAGTYVKSVTLNFDNALRSQEAIGTLGAVGIGTGTINCTADVQVYFANKDLFTKYRTNVNTSLIFASTDEAGNGYIFTLPVGNISTWKSNAGSKDNDQMIDVTLTALSDDSNAVAGLRKCLFVDRIGVAVV